MKDAAMIKLFGKTIPISEIDLNRNVSVTSSSYADGLHEEQRLCSIEKDQEIDHKKLSEKEFVTKKQEIGQSQDLTGSLGISENPKTPSNDKETSSLRTSKDEEKSDGSHEKTPLKKPDKILPCPRCNSKETKFCYYNNYNVSQPRHFCKNCQRYWTSGGTMRNVPVGAGRRKNKSSSTSQYHHLIVSEALRTAQLGNNAIVLRFGSDSDSALTLQSDKSKSSSGSSMTGSNSSGNSWMPYPLNSAQWNSTMPPPGFPMTFFPTAPPPYMSYAVPAQCISPAHSSVKNSNHNSTILGKHSREDALGIKSEKKSLTTTGVRMFDGFQSKGGDKIPADTKSLYLQANPAAMSRSVKFRES